MTGEVLETGSVVARYTRRPAHTRAGISSDPTKTRVLSSIMATQSRGQAPPAGL